MQAGRIGVERVDRHAAGVHVLELRDRDERARQLAARADLQEPTARRAVLLDQVERLGRQALRVVEPARVRTACVGEQHGPPVPADRYKDAFADENAPRPPSFDEEDVSDKPPWISDMSRFSEDDISSIDTLYRNRLGTMLSVDEMVNSLIRELKKEGQLDNTFIFFASDNGFLMGQHRIQNDKRYPYEESVRTPLFVRGPGVPAGAKVEDLVANTDFAPTIADLAGASVSSADGRSLAPLLRGEDPSWRSAILLEEFQRPNKKRSLPPYEAIRTETNKYVEYATGDKELYDLQADPYELDNVYESADPSLVAELKTRLDALKSCVGEGCRETEDGA